MTESVMLGIPRTEKRVSRRNAHWERIVVRPLRRNKVDRRVFNAMNGAKNKKGPKKSRMLL